MEISTGENSVTENAENNKTETGQAVGSSNTSNSVPPGTTQIRVSMGELLKKVYMLALDTLKTVQNLDGKFEIFCNLENRRNVDYKNHFDSMCAKLFGETGYRTPLGGAKSTLGTPGLVDNSAENTPKAGISENKTEGFEIQVGPHQVGPGDLVLILDSTLFGGIGEVHANETTDVENAALTYIIDGQNQTLDSGVNVVSKEQDKTGDCPTERKIQVLEMRQPVGFKAKHLEPAVVVEHNVFRVSLDVSFFDVENITCAVGNKLSVHARVGRRNDYGSEIHEIRQVFEVPELADRERFTAYIKNCFLHVEAPMKPSKEALMDTS